MLTVERMPSRKQLPVQGKLRFLQIFADPGFVVPDDPAGAGAVDRRPDALFHRRLHLRVQGEDEEPVVRFIVEEEARPAVGNELAQFRDHHAEDRADAEAGVDDARKLADELDLSHLAGGRAGGQAVLRSVPHHDGPETGPRVLAGNDGDARMEGTAVLPETGGRGRYDGQPRPVSTASPRMTGTVPYRGRSSRPVASRRPWAHCHCTRRPRRPRR